MIRVIDDRQLRQRKKLDGISSWLSNAIHFFSGEELQQFRKEITEELELECLAGSEIVCAHATSLFETGNPNSRNHFERWCLGQEIPIIYFSGGNNYNSTIRNKEIYSCNVDSFYTRIKKLKPEEIDSKNPDLLLFGRNHVLNKLLVLRRKLFICNTYSDIYHILDDKYAFNEPILLKVFAEWEALPSSAGIADWIKIINREIEKNRE